MAANALGVAAFLTALLASRAKQISDDLADLVVGILFAVWMYFLVLPRGDVLQPSERPPDLYRTATEKLAGCSYSVYAIHMPLLMLMRARITAKPWPPDRHFLAVAGLMAFVAIAAGYLFSRLTESKTDAVRRWFFRLQIPASPLRSLAKP